MHNRFDYFLALGVRFPTQHRVHDLDFGNVVGLQVLRKELLIGYEFVFQEFLVQEVKQQITAQTTQEIKRIFVLIVEVFLPVFFF